MHRRQFVTGLGALGVSRLIGAAERGAPLRAPDVIFVPTPNEVVETMLRMAAVRKQDVVYDLGCGDGRIVITAAQRYGARGVGIDIDPERVAEATENANRAGVADRVKIIRGDLFQADIRGASVVTLYLLTDLNLKLRPKLLRELNPGTRVVSHAFAMGDWEPERTEEVSGTTVYLWRIPPRAA
jgi:SAM-dependent methyltransferase